MWQARYMIPHRSAGGPENTNILLHRFLSFLSI